MSTSQTLINYQTGALIYSFAWTCF